MNEFKMVGLFIATILIFTVLTPFGYSYDNEESPIIELTERELCLQSGDCGIWVSRLDWNEYNNLLVQAEQGYIDGFGNNEVQTDNTGTAEELDDQFFINAEGQAVMMYDMMKQKIVDPTKNACHLNRLTTRGFVSYATRLDQNTRFCAEYADETCEKGDTPEIIKNALDAQLANMNDVSNDFLTQPIDTLEEIWEGHLDDLNCEYEEDKAKKVRESLKDDDRQPLYELLYECMEHEKLKAGGGSDGRLNILESNSTYAYVFPHANTIFQFPAQMALYIQDLQKIADEEYWVAVFTTATTIAAIGNIGMAIKAWRFGRAGGAARIEKIAKKGKLGRSWRNYFNKLFKRSTNSLDYTDELMVKLPDNPDDLVGGVKASERIEQYARASNLDPAAISAEASRRAGANAAPEVVFQAKKQVLKESIDTQRKAITRLKELADAGDVDGIQKFFKETPTYGTKSGFDEASEWIDSTFWDDAEKGAAKKLLETEKAWETVDPTTQTKLRKMFKDQGLSDSMEDILKHSKQYVGPSAGKYDDLLNVLNEDMKYNNKISSYMKARYPSLSKFFKPAGALDKIRRWFANSVLKAIGRSANILRMARIQAYIPYIMNSPLVGVQPLPVFTLRGGLEFEMNPETKMGNEKDKTSFFEIIKVSPVGGLYAYDVMPEDWFEHLASNFNVDLKKMFGDTEGDAVADTMANIGDHVMLIDQETSSGVITIETLGETPFNMIFPYQDATGANKWSFLGITPTPTGYYAFEHPSSYEEVYEDDKTVIYTGMGLVVQNVKIAAMTNQIDQDWARYQFDEMMTTPGWGSWLKLSAIGGATAFIPGGMAMAGTVITVMIAQQFGGTITDMGAEIQEQRAGLLIDPKEQWAGDKHCSIERTNAIEDIMFALRAKEATTGIAFGLEVAELALTASGVGAPLAAALMVAQIGVSIADYVATDELNNAKQEGMEKMHECYETAFELFAYQKLVSKEDKVDELTALLESGIEGIANTIGPSLQSVLPGVKDALDDIAKSSFETTMTVSGTLNEKNLVNVFGKEVYQVHFDRETDLQWNLDPNNPQCYVQLCYETVDPETKKTAFKCMEAHFYALLDENGNLIVEGPEVGGLQWKNSEGYASITQKVINIEKNSDILMEIYPDGRVEVKGCAADRIKNELHINKLDDKFGRLIGIYTMGDAEIWVEPGQIGVRHLHDTGCGAGLGQLRRYSGAHLEVYRDGKIVVVDKDGEPVDDCSTFYLGANGFLNFENAKIAPGSAVNTVKRVIGGKEVTVQLSGGYGNVLHLFMGTLLEISNENIIDLDFKDTEDVDGDGFADGVIFDWDLKDDDEEKELNDLMDDSPFTDFTSMNNETLEVRDGDITYTDVDGQTAVYEIIETNDEGCLVLRNKQTGKIELLCPQMGPNGPEFIWKNEDGTMTGRMPFVLGWPNTGFGASMGNNGITMSFKNEFPLAINPAFNNYGATGVGMFKPGVPPWGGRVQADGGDIVTPGSDNILAALPLTPEGPVLILFIIVLLCSLMIVRVRYSTRRVKK